MTNEQQKFSLLAMGVAVLLAGSGLYAGAIGRRNRVDQVPAESRSIESGQEGTPSPAWPPPVIVVGDYAPSEVPLDSLIETASIIADVEVEEVLATQFNTPSGAMPTQDSSGDEGGLAVFTPVVLRVTRLYKTGLEAVDGLIVSEFGGQIGEFSMLVYPIQPFTAAELPMYGVGFFESLEWDTPISSEGQWILTLQEIAEQRSLSTGLRYVPAHWHEMFVLNDVNTDSASAVGLSTQMDYTESDLRYLLNTSLNLPIPTKTQAPPGHEVP